MLSKVLLNNVKQYKKRDASMDQFASFSKAHPAKHLKLPQISNQIANSNLNNFQPQQNTNSHVTKYLKSRGIPLEEGSSRKKMHARMLS